MVSYVISTYIACKSTIFIPYNLLKIQLILREEIKQPFNFITLRFFANCHRYHFRGFQHNAFIISARCTIIPISVDYSSVFM